MQFKYSILINTCDLYSDVWPMFFHILKKTWKLEFPRVYVNTERLQYDDNDLNLIFLNVLPEKKDISWGERLLDCLDRIEEEYVLMLLEDFFFEDEINISKIEQSVNILENNSKIAAFQYVPAAECYHGNFLKKEIILDGFARRKQFGKFKIIAGPSMWRKEDLINLTQGGDTPWEWEYFGSYRTWFYGKDFYCWVKKEQPIFNYDIEHGGAIHRGKWVGYKVNELAKKYDFPIEYGNREVEENWMKQNLLVPKVPMIRRLKTIFKNRCKILKNILLGIKLKGNSPIKKE